MRRASEILRRGGLVAFPTETVYGLGAHALDAAAVRRIFEAKGRPAFNPLIVHLAEPGGALALVEHWPAEAARLAEAFWPGPLTLVLPKRPVVPDEVTAGRSSVAVRVPAHPVARELLRASGLPLAAPSANRYMAVSPTTALHVERSLGDRVELILDGGPTEVGIESTVIDLSRGGPRLLRAGTISRAAVEEVTGPLDGASEPEPGSEAPRPAPGMIRRHYAPRAGLRVFAAASGPQAAELVAAARAAGERVGSLLIGSPEVGADVSLRLPSDAGGYAAGLYAALHALDDAGCTLILAEEPPAGSEWEGVRDRLSRASHPPDG